MSFYSIDAANARIADTRDLLLQLKQQREELIGLRDRLLDLAENAGEEGFAERTGAEPGRADGDRTSRGRTRREDMAERVGTERTAVEEARLIRLKMQGLIDQMQAAVQQLVDWNITLRDIETGLIDFPALVNGRQVWLCWRLGEEH